MRKIILISVSVVVMIVVFVWGIVVYESKSSKNSQKNQPCTQEAKVCPDGSAVGRMGPNCEFGPCPETNAALTQEEAKKITPEGLNIKVSVPAENAIVGSPLVIQGTAKNWYFEASFPIKLVDENGNVLAQGTAQAKGDWTVDDFVPFEARLVFDSAQARKGEIIFEKDNPSGLPENDQSFRLPILFNLWYN